MLELICSVCSRHRYGDEDPFAARSLLTEARVHCRETGHTVWVYDTPREAFIFERTCGTVLLERTGGFNAA